MYCVCVMCFCVCNVCLRLLVNLSTLSGLTDISHLASHCCNMFRYSWSIAVYIMLSIYRPVEQAVIGKQTDVR